MTAYNWEKKETMFFHSYLIILCWESSKLWLLFIFSHFFFIISYSSSIMFVSLYLNLFFFGILYVHLLEASEAWNFLSPFVMLQTKTWIWKDLLCHLKSVYNKLISSSYCKRATEESNITNDTRKMIPESRFLFTAVEERTPWTHRQQASCLH